MTYPKSIPAQTKYSLQKLLSLESQNHFIQSTKEKGYKPAAVLFPICIDHKKSYVILTKRHKNLSTHPGQIAFPGGRIEKNDMSPMYTALRETNEEIGLKQKFISVCGVLPTRQTSSKFNIIPFVAHVKNGFSLKKQQNEVKEIIRLPLEFLSNPDNHLYDHNLPKNPYYMQWEKYKIWGVTASIIRDFYEICM